MALAGVFGRQLARPAGMTREAVSMLEVGAGAFGSSYLAALSRMKKAKAGQTGGGELFGVPYTLLGAVVLGAAGLAGVGGSRSSDLMNLAKGSVAAYAATKGIQMAAASTGQPATVGALPPGGAYLSGDYALSGDQYAAYGATPETERLFREAGL